jgi:hypothetical protein
MIEREVRSWGRQSDTSWQLVLDRAGKWMADADFSATVYAWNFPNMSRFGLRFVALTESS